MSYVYGISNASTGYQAQSSQEELIARTTTDKDEQVRIAKGSTSNRVLLALAANRRLEPDATQELFSRNIDTVTRRLERLGYESSFFNSIF